MRRGGRARVRVIAVATTVLALAGCSAPTAASPSAAAATSAAARTSAATAPAAPAASPSRTPTLAQRAAALVARMSVDERAGQLLMTAGTVSQLPSLAADVRRYHLGGVMVRGRSSAGTTAVARAFHPLQAAAPSGLPLLTATDQEGGLVQVLSGSGFTTIPAATVQATRSAATLQRQAEGWGKALAKAGVRLDLAPVAGVPCAADLHRNPPIAALLRNYGTDPVSAGAHVAAFVKGMRAAGVDTTVKHFPGLGCVTANTDTTAHVVDTSTTTTSPRLAAFRAGIDADPAFVMVSSAEYARIDPGVPALFSSKIIGGLLRGRFGYGGVVMSDDVGGAVAVKAWTPGQRATKFVAAGGDLLLDIVPADLPAEHAALVQRAEHDPAFARLVTAAATRVVTARMALAAH